MDDDGGQVSLSLSLSHTHTHTVSLTHTHALAHKLSLSHRVSAGGVHAMHRQASFPDQGAAASTPNIEAIQEVGAIQNVGAIHELALPFNLMPSPPSAVEVVRPYPGS